MRRDEKKAWGDLVLTVAGVVAILVGGLSAIVLFVFAVLGVSSGGSPPNGALPILVACGFCGLLVLLRTGGSMPTGRTLFLSIAVVVLFL